MGHRSRSLWVGHPTFNRKVKLGWDMYPGNILQDFSTWSDTAWSVLLYLRSCLIVFAAFCHYLLSVSLSSSILFSYNMLSVTSTETVQSLPPGFNPPTLTLPGCQTAIVQGPGGKATIYNDVALPEPEPHMVLVKTAAISINPCDWKMPSKFPSPGARIGCDFVGTVIAIGPEAARMPLKVKIGDRVSGGIHGSNPIDYPSGSFAEYVAAHGDLLLQLPDSMTFEEGAVLGGSGIATLRLALYESLRLTGTPESPLKGGSIPHVLVYGGSTSTGTMALQILRLCVQAHPSCTIGPLPLNPIIICHLTHDPHPIIDPATHPSRRVRPPTTPS